MPFSKTARRNGFHSNINDQETQMIIYETNFTTSFSVSQREKFLTSFKIEKKKKEKKKNPRFGFF